MPLPTVPPLPTVEALQCPLLRHCRSQPSSQALTHTPTALSLLSRVQFVPVPAPPVVVKKPAPPPPPPVVKKVVVPPPPPPVMPSSHGTPPSHSPGLLAVFNSNTCQRGVH